jgi:hypothetical protein
VLRPKRWLFHLTLVLPCVAALSPSQTQVPEPAPPESFRRGLTFPVGENHDS